ncbi:MAG: dihydrofolate reductase [Patescibacteria group bacterium]
MIHNSNSRVSIIVAIDEKRGIGKNNSIPWHLSADLKRFKALTTGHTIIMGRKTWDSLPKKPLPNRLNIVLSRDSSRQEVQADPESPVLFFFELNLALKEAIGFETERNKENPEIFIIGGAQIFQQAIDMGVADRLYLTQVEGDFGCDTFFPDYAEFKKVLSEESGEENGIKYKYINLER